MAFTRSGVRFPSAPPSPLFVRFLARSQGRRAATECDHLPGLPATRDNQARLPRPPRSVAVCRLGWPLAVKRPLKCVGRPVVAAPSALAQLLHDRGSLFWRAILTELELHALALDPQPMVLSGSCSNCSSLAFTASSSALISADAGMIKKNSSKNSRQSRFMVD